MKISEVDYRELQESPSVGAESLTPNLDMLKHVNVTLDIKVGHVILSVADLFQLKSGSVLVLDRLVEEPVEVT